MDEKIRLKVFDQLFCPMNLKVYTCTKLNSLITTDSILLRSVNDILYGQIQRSLF